MHAPASAARTIAHPVLLALVLIAPHANAQTPRRPVHHADAGVAPARGPASLDSPGHFQGAAPLPTQSVSSGSAATEATAPSSDELRGPSGPAPDVITGPIGPSDAARVVQSQMVRLRPCYESARATHPRLAGRLELRFTLDRTGRVTQAAAFGMPDAPEVATCLAAALRATTFPRPSEPPLQIFYPITFAAPPVAPATHGHGAPAAHPAHH